MDSPAGKMMAKYRKALAKQFKETFAASGLSLSEVSRKSGVGRNSLEAVIKNKNVSTDAILLGLAAVQRPVLIQVGSVRRQGKATVSVA